MYCSDILHHIWYINFGIQSKAVKCVIVLSLQCRHTEFNVTADSASVFYHTLDLE